METNLNIVYIGPHSFPLGGATTKRRKYMVDYMNTHGIQSHVLITGLKKDLRYNNASSGIYGLADYYDLTPFAIKFQMSKFLSEGKKKLNNWFINDKKNILIFPTIITVFEWPLYKYAEQLGYKVIFDQVETSFFLNGKMSFLHWLYIGMSEKLSHFAYKKNAAFVISTALYDAVHSKYPNRKICLLPNSTPLHNDKAKKILHNPLLILYSGTYSPKDGVTYLIEGVIKAFEQGCQCRLILLGKGTPEDMKVLNKIKNKKYIEYRGFVSDEELINTMKNCDVLCMTRTNYQNI